VATRQGTLPRTPLDRRRRRAACSVSGLAHLPCLSRGEIILTLFLDGASFLSPVRYGNAGRDWARKEVHQQGIAPVVVRHDIQSLATSRSVTRDAYNSEGASTKSREVAGIDARHIEDMFQPEVVPHVAEWIKSSSPWAAEVLLDMLRDVAANSADAARDGVHSAPGTRSPVKLPDMHTL
jgi:hypothetical protein